MLTNFLGVLFDGVAYGSLLFLISVGLSVTMGLMNSQRPSVWHGLSIKMQVSRCGASTSEPA